VNSCTVNRSTNDGTTEGQRILNRSTRETSFECVTATSGREVSYLLSTRLRGRTLWKRNTEVHSDVTDEISSTPERIHCRQLILRVMMSTAVQQLFHRLEHRHNETYSDANTLLYMSMYQLRSNGISSGCIRENVGERL